MSSAIKALNDSGVGPTIYCMTCGHFTPDQCQIVSRRCQINTETYLAIYQWFVTQSGHPAFKNLSLPTDLPKPQIIKELNCTNTDDFSGDYTIKMHMKDQLITSLLHKNRPMTIQCIILKENFQLHL